MPQSAVRPLRARMQMIFQDPISCLSPRKTVAQLLLEPFTMHGIAVDREAQSRAIIGNGGIILRAGGQVSSPAFRRTGAPGGHCTRAGTGAIPAGRRRAYSRIWTCQSQPGILKLDERPARAIGSDLHPHHPQSKYHQFHCGPRGSDVPGQTGGGRAVQPPCSRSRSIPTRKRSCRRSRYPTPACDKSAPVLFWKEKSPARETRHRDAHSIRAADIGNPCALRRRRHYGEYQIRVIWSHATFRVGRDPWLR